MAPSSYAVAIWVQCGVCSQVSDVTTLPELEAQVRTLQRAHQLMAQQWLLDSWDVIWGAADNAPLPGTVSAQGSLVAQHTAQELVLDLLPCFSWCSTTGRFVRMVRAVDVPSPLAAGQPPPLARVTTA